LLVNIRGSKYLFSEKYRSLINKIKENIGLAKDKINNSQNVKNFIK